MVRQGWGAKVKGAIPKVGRLKARVCQTKGGNLSIWATNLQSLRRSRRRKNRQRRLQRSRKAARLLQRSKLQNPRSKKRESASFVPAIENPRCCSKGSGN